MRFPSDERLQEIAKKALQSQNPAKYRDLKDKNELQEFAKDTAKNIVETYELNLSDARSRILSVNNNKPYMEIVSELEAAKIEIFETALSQWLGDLSTPTSPS